MRPFPAGTAALLLALAVVSTGAAAEPAEVAVGDMIVVRTASSERWFIQPHGGTKRNLLVITVSADGEVSMDTQPLPDKPAGQPDDPDDPEPQSLRELVREWSRQINDSANAMKLAAAYQATVQLIDQERVTTVEQLLALQSLANTTLLGSATAKWRPFFEKLAAHLDANTPADLAGYRAAWMEISEGLR